MKLANRHAVITGSTSGLGRAIAELFAREGARVVIHGRNAERGQQVVEAIEKQGGEALFVAGDITQEADAKRVVAQATERFGPVDILINNAGVVYPGALPDIDLDTWNATFHTNVTSTYLMSHLVLPSMIERQQGVIIHMSSEAGLKGLKNRAAYCSAKAALVGLTKAMAVDHSPQGVRVNCICPGTIETPMVANVIESHPNPAHMRQELINRRLLPFLGKPEDIAAAALYLASDEGRFITGTILSVDGGTVAK